MVELQIGYATNTQVIALSRLPHMNVLASSFFAVLLRKLTSVKAIKGDPRFKHPIVCCPQVGHPLEIVQACYATFIEDKLIPYTCLGRVSRDALI